MPTVVLSSGFLAFARHIGVARACQRAGLTPRRLSGVSSGALIGAMWAAGASPEDMLGLVTESAPLRSLRPRFFFGRGGPGLFSLDALVERLARRLPARIEDLPVPFSVGVVRREGATCHLVERGPLPEAIAASCAMPWIFGPRFVDDHACVDGGARDRLFLRPLLERHPSAQTLVHLVASSAPGREARGAVVAEQLAWAESRTALRVVHTPRSGASFFSLGDVAAAVALAERRTLEALESAVSGRDARA